MSAIIYAAAHAVPVILAGAVTRSRGTVTLAAIVMGGLAVAMGAGRYAFIDLVFVAIGYLAALALCSTKAAGDHLILQGDYRNLASNPPPALPRRDEQPPRPLPSEKLTLPKAAWLDSSSAPEIRIERCASYSEAGVRAKALAQEINRTVHIERGGDGVWYVGVKASGDMSLEACYKDKHDHKTYTSDRQLLTEHDADIERYLIRKDLRK